MSRGLFPFCVLHRTEWFCNLWWMCEREQENIPPEVSITGYWINFYHDIKCEFLQTDWNSFSLVTHYQTFCYNLFCFQESYLDRSKSLWRFLFKNFSFGSPVREAITVKKMCRNYYNKRIPQKHFSAIHALFRKSVLILTIGRLTITTVNAFILI